MDSNYSLQQQTPGTYQLPYKNEPATPPSDDHSAYPYQQQYSQQYVDPAAFSYGAPQFPWYDPTMPIPGAQQQDFVELQPAVMQPLTNMQPLQPMQQATDGYYQFSLKNEPDTPPAPIDFHMPYELSYKHEPITPVDSDFPDFPTFENPENAENVEPELEVKAAVSKTVRGRKRKAEGEVDSRVVKKKSTLLNPINIATTPVVVEPQEPATKFCTVGGRLCLIGSLISYDVCTDEIKRRASLPEGLIKSHIGPLLKRGKVKGTGDELLKLLEEHAIEIKEPTVNRKQYPMSTLTAMLEGESVQLSADHRELALAHLPLTSLARLLIRTIESPTELATAAAEAKAAKQSMESFISVLNQWTAGGWEAGKAVILASPLHLFAKATHALGVEEIMVMTSLYQRFLQTLEEELHAYIRKVFASGCPADLLDQFPPGVEPPQIPSGRLYKPDMKEQAYASSSFTEISGRLTLQNKKYNVTVAEVHRRVRAPECFNLSILGSMLKKGKTKDNCTQLKNELKEYNINLDSGRRKSAKNTTFTSLTEGEALDLVKDMVTEVERSFPAGDLAKSIVEQADTSTLESIQNAVNGFGYASRIAMSLRAVVISLRLPVAERIPNKINPDAHLMFNYCNLTHGYGPDAIASWMAIFDNLFKRTMEAFPQC